MAISGVLGGVFAQQGAAQPFTQETMTDVDGNGVRFRIDDVTKRYWDKKMPVIVETSPDGTNWTTVPASEYRVEYVGGHVVFKTARPGETQVRVSGACFNVMQIGGFFEWSLDFERETEDVTTFDFDGWAESVPTSISASGSASRYWAVSNEFFELLGKEVILVLYVDRSTNRRYEGYFILTGHSVETPSDSFIEEQLDFESAGEVYYRED
ncbi:hypothetical protein BSNK01_28350 [Bacillaceae bacterium]